MALCHFGLAVPKAGRVFDSGKWGLDVEALEEPEFKSKHKKVVGLLNSSEERCGSFDAVQFLAGSKTCQVLVEREFLKPGSALVTNNSGKRPFSVWSSDDSTVTSSSASTKRSRVV